MREADLGRYEFLSSNTQDFIEVARSRDQC